MAKPCASSDWYVVQVMGGQESKMCARIRRACVEAHSDVLEECFSPSFMTRRKCKGKWRQVQKNLLPGYVIAVTSDAAKLQRVLWAIREFARVIKVGETYVPLAKDERAWIDAYTNKGERVIPLSVAYKEGDRIVVESGPLKGREGAITRINRKKCQATIELHVGGKRLTTQVGLAVLPREQQRAKGSTPFAQC